MAAALGLGRRGMGRVWPNPAVGCVIVRDGVIVGRGVTAPGGRPHAEPQALAQAGDAASGATVYVTLEPCAHHGQTPPCAQTLIDAGVARVVVATGDPDPRVAGQGIAMLQAAGIPVTQGVRQAEADTDHAGFFSRVTKGRPFLTLKLATSLDGRIATSTGDSQWITGPQARHMVHAMRARHDAVMVGAGTVRADNPALNVREMGAVSQPVRIVVSSALDLPVESHLYSTADILPLWLCHAADAKHAQAVPQGAKLISCASNAGRVDVTSVLSELGAAGLTRVFCEGGGALAASLLQAGLVDELVVFSGGVAIGADGTPALGDLGLQELSTAPRYRLKSMQKIGRDVMACWVP